MTMAGLAEHIRMLLLDQGVDFVDDQFSREAWYGGRKKEALFGQCPFLTEPGGRQIPQSGTIMRHLARVHGLYGASEEEATQLDFVADGAHDLRLKYYQIIYREYVPSSSSCSSHANTGRCRRRRGSS